MKKSLIMALVLGLPVAAIAQQSSAPAPKPTAVYEFKDQDTVALNVRVQRNF